jgi:hypothetical protein
MAQGETGRFTVAVFQDVASATKGVEALGRRGFAVGVLSMIARDTPDAGAFIDRAMGGGAVRLDVAGLGPALVKGTLIATLAGDSRDLERLGIAASMLHAGFQQHDGQIFASLVARGGVLVAVEGEPRAADALATFFSYGGGNAAIGAWTGRL